MAGRLLGRLGDLRIRCRASTWVIPQMRWLHEMDRLFPRGQGVPDKHGAGPADGLRTCPA